MKTILKAISDRVFRSYKSTLVGLGIGVGLIALETFATTTPADAPSWLKALAALAAIVGASLKSKALAPSA